MKMKTLRRSRTRSNTFPAADAVVMLISLLLSPLYLIPGTCASVSLHPAQRLGLQRNVVLDEIATDNAEHHPRADNEHESKQQTEGTEAHLHIYRRDEERHPRNPTEQDQKNSQDYGENENGSASTTTAITPAQQTTAFATNTALTAKTTTTGTTTTSTTTTSTTTTRTTTTAFTTTSATTTTASTTATTSAVGTTISIDPSTPSASEPTAPSANVPTDPSAPSANAPTEPSAPSPTPPSTPHANAPTQPSISTANVPTEPSAPSPTPASTLGRPCEPNSNGFYGRQSQKKIEVLYKYQIETDPSKLAKGNLEAKVLPNLENKISDSLLPVLFPSICGGENRRRMTTTWNPVRTPRRLKIVNEVVGVTASPDDFVTGVDCEIAMTVSSNDCSMVQGELWVFITGSETNETDVILGVLREGFASNRFVDAHESIVKITYLEDSPLEVAKGPVQSREVDSSQPSDNGTRVFPYLMAGACSALAIVGLVAFRRKQLKDDDEEEEDSLCVGADDNEFDEEEGCDQAMDFENIDDSTTANTTLDTSGGRTNGNSAVGGGSILMESVMEEKSEEVDDIQ